MATIITREVGVTAKGTPLTSAEVDQNFINLNTTKLEAANIQAVHGVDISTDVSGNVLIDVKNFGGTCKNVSGATIAKGTPVYQVGVTGTAITVAPADASNPTKMPAVGVVGKTIASEAEGDIIFLGYITGVDTSTFGVGDEVYVAAGGGYTNVKPTNASGHLIQFLGVVNRVHASNGSGIIFGTATAQTQSLEKTDSVVFAGVTAPLSGNATTATTLQTARTISLTGDVAYTSGSFNGSANVTGTATLATVNSNTGTFGSSTQIPSITVNAKGLVTAVSTTAVSIPSGAISVTGGDLTLSGTTGTAITNATLASIGTAGTYTKVTTDAKGRVTSGTTLASGDIPNLDASKITSGTIDAARLPSYVDDVVEAANLASFPATGETGKIYVALDTNKTYRWSGSTYVFITSGAIDSVAGKTGVVTLTSSDVGLGNVENKSSATIRGEITSGNVTTALGFTPYNATNPSGYTTNTGTVTSVGGTGTVSGLTLTGSVTGSGNLTLGGTLSLTSGQVTTALGFTPYNSTNPSGYTTNTGTVTSVGGTGGYGGLTLSGSVTTSGSLTLGGTPTGTWPISVSGNAATATNVAYGGLTGTVPTWNQNTTGNAATATTATNQSGGTVNATTGAFSGQLTINNVAYFNAGTGASDFNDVNLGGAGGWASNEAHGINTYYGSLASPIIFTRVDSLFDGTKATMRWKNFYFSGPQTATVMTLTATSASAATLNVVGNITLGGSQVLTAGNFNSYSPTLTGTGASGTWGVSITGNAATATTLQTARTINGVSFNGSANITVADATKLPLAGGTMTGALLLPAAGYLTGSNVFEKLLDVNFPNGTANLAANIRFGNLSFWGYIEVEVTGAYSNQNAAGKLTKLFAVGTNPGNLIYNNTSRVADIMGSIPDSIAIGEFAWDATNSTYIIPISHIGSLGNPYSIKVRMFTQGGGANAVFPVIAMSANYALTSLAAHTAATYNGNLLINGTSQVLHAGNFNSYALPLSGGSLSGVLTINSTNDNQLLLRSTDSWTGIGFDDSAALGAEYIWHNGTNGTFAIGGGGANVASKKLHVHGGMTIGAGYAGTANPTNGLNVEGAIQQAGSQVLHAGNFNSYSPTLTGTGASGTWGINVTGTAANVTGTVAAANGGTGLTSAGASGNVLTSNGTAWTSAALPAGGTSYIYTTTAVTATNRQGVLTSTAGGAFTVTLPASPATGAQVVIADAGNAWGTNNLTVARNGSTIGGLAEDLVCDITGASVQFVFDGTTWEVYTQLGAQGGTVLTLTSAQTITNKTIDYANNTLTGVVGVTATQTLTNKTINYANNTLTGVVGVTATQTLTNKTLDYNANTFTNFPTTNLAQLHAVALSF